MDGISQAKIQERLAISYTRGSSWFRDQTCVSCISRRILYLWATREPENLPELHWKNREQFCFKVLENEILFDSEDVHNFFQITNFLFRCVQPAAKYNHYFCCFGSCIFFILEVHFFFKYACYFVEFPIPCVGFPCGSVVKNLPANAGDLGSIPDLGRSPGRGNGSPLQYSCLGNPMDRRDWRATVHEVTRVRRNWVTVKQKQQFHAYIFVLLFVSLNMLSDFFLSFLKNKPDLIITIWNL